MTRPKWIAQLLHRHSWTLVIGRRTLRLACASCPAVTPGVDVLDVPYSVNQQKGSCHAPVDKHA